MAVPRTRPAVLAVALALAGVTLAGCGLGNGESSGTGAGASESADDAAPQAKARVQAYLDAMKAKDPAAGRSQLCGPLRATFDLAATGPTGDFAKHFTVVSTQITEVTADGGRQRVDAVVQATVAKQKFTRGITFAVTSDAGTWCIAEEAPGPTPGPDPDLASEAPGGASQVSPGAGKPAS